MDNEPCSVLEMLIALAYRCEELRHDPEYGDRTGQWFWEMIVNLKLDEFDDANYNETKVTQIVNRFLSRKYQPNGKGGLFFIANPREDLRKVDIWMQMQWCFAESTEDLQL